MFRLPVIMTLIYGAGSGALALCFMIFPKEAFDASIRGMTVWWEVVFPSLLPFFILSEFLIRFGLVAFAGKILEPLMRPLFRVPGEGGFVWAMGLASGFPSGAKLTARLWEEGIITRSEGERLASFSNASNPLFIFGAIAVGFFENAALGLLLAAAHYGGNLITGLCMRWHDPGERPPVKRSVTRFSLRKAFKDMHEVRLKQRQPLGKTMGEAVDSSVRTLLMIGGFMIFFSVLNEMLSIIKLSDLLALSVSIILGLTGMPKELSPGIISGLFEITLGSQQISAVSQSPLLYQAVAVSFILAFNGLSVQAQVASILAKTEIRYRPFFVARCIHAIAASALAYVLFDRLYSSRISGTLIPVSEQAAEEVIPFWLQIYQFMAAWGGLITLLCLVFWLTMRIMGK